MTTYFPRDPHGSVHQADELTLVALNLSEVRHLNVQVFSIHGTQAHEVRYIVEENNGYYTVSYWTGAHWAEYYTNNIMVHLQQKAT